MSRWFQRGLRVPTAVAAATVTVVAVTGCSLSPNDLPSVRAGVSAAYHLTMQFESVLNLPTGADVNLNGLRVGSVESMRPTPAGVDVTVGIAAGTEVPRTATAIIRQDTLLGDTYVAISSSSGAPSSDRLTDGGVIPLTATTSPPQLEDTIAQLAYFVNGGSIQKIQDTMIKLNRTLPERAEVRKMAGVVSKDLADLGENTAEIDRTLAGLTSLGREIGRSRETFRTLFSGAATPYWDGIAHKSIGHLAVLLPSVGSIFEGGLWAVPMLEASADNVVMGRGIYDKAPIVAGTLEDFVRNTLVPFGASPRVNVVSVREQAGPEQIADAQKVLRMLGAIR